ncbi:MAG: hypothetical protein ACRCUY_10300 [Thermoguttaceae bacterium]
MFSKYQLPFLAAYFAAFTGGLGTGLFSTHLLRFLIYDICTSFQVGNVAFWFGTVLAIPRFAGIFRLFTPVFIDWSGHRKRFCIVALITAPLIVSAIPLLLPMAVHLSQDGFAPTILLWGIIAIWSLYNLVQYMGIVALFSWFGDFVPEETRGQFFGRREAWFIAGLASGLICMGFYSIYVIDQLPKDVPRWTGYLAPTYCSLVALFCSAGALMAIPETPWKRRTDSIGIRLLTLLAPLSDKRFAAFVFFGCWVQMSQALTQGAQSSFSIAFLGISMVVNLALSSTTRVGQWMVGSTTGRLTDFLGTLPIMMTSLILAASGSLFYYFAEKETWWLLFGAALVWIFWIGVNIGITRTIVDLSPKLDNAPYFAVYFTLSAICFALFTWIGGAITPVGMERTSFLLSFELRLLSVPLLWLIFRKCQTAR